MTLTNKVAIITGAKQGIGLGIAKVLAQAGCRVVLADLDLAGSEAALSEIKQSGGEGLAVKCDVTQPAEVDQMIAAAVQKFGHLDILVNNAGIFPFVPFDQMTVDDWNEVMDVNLKSIFLCTKAAVKVMAAGAKIINISSIAALVGFNGLTHYCASKGGVNSFTRALALELAPKNINVNAIAPGAIDTPGATGAVDEKTKQQMTANIPARRYGLPEDIGQAVAFLASDNASYITGQTLVVDGGWTIQ
ncbi:MAG: SDR family NAD(P)-dependent oxidoreductase [Patescibacteria group bacterium]